LLDATKLSGEGEPQNFAYKLKFKIFQFLLMVLKFQRKIIFKIILISGINIWYIFYFSNVPKKLRGKMLGLPSPPLGCAYVFMQFLKFIRIYKQLAG
jgi:hypothetical protein